MPAFNEEKNIEKVITSWVSVLNKYPGSEILVINDGPKDKTAEILTKLSQKYKFLKVIDKENEGHVHRQYLELLLTKIKKKTAMEKDW